MAKIIIIGSGLAGLSAAFSLQDQGHEVEVLEAAEVVGGRTSSWNENGMKVESGLHRYLGFYHHMPQLLGRAGLDLNKIFYWEDEIEIKLPHGPSGVFGLAPFFHPLETLASLVGNNHMFNPLDKLNILRLFTLGFKDYLTQPRKLDQITIQDYAEDHNINKKIIERLLIPTTAGILFLPPDRYSAFNYFGLFAPYLPRVPKARVGAFRGGMTEIMSLPLAKAIQARGGKVYTQTKVEKLIYQNDNIRGVQVNGEKSFADHIILATSLAPAQQLLKQVLADHPWFKPMLGLASTSSTTIQIELSERSVPHQDRTTFAPKTSLACFSEQSQTTFTHVPGRLSIILTPPEKFLDLTPEQILPIVIKDLKKIKINIENKVLAYRVVNRIDDFYSLAPHHKHLRPPQKTPLRGLILAGDYTRQKYLATMEGAVYSGKLAAEILKKN